MGAAHRRIDRRPVFLAIWTVTALALAGCGLSRQQEAMEELGKSQQVCFDRVDSGEIRTRAAGMQCLDDAMIVAYQKMGYPYMDLIFVLAARRVVIAEKIDRGEITETEGKAQLADLLSQVTEQARLRTIEAQTANAASAAATAQQMQAFTAITRSATPIQSCAVYCSRFGYSTVVCQ